MNIEELNTLVNTWEEGSIGWFKETSIIAILDLIGKEIGYGALEDLTKYLYEIQCNNNPTNAIHDKIARFKALEWKLPKKFNEIANKYEKNT